MPIYNNCSTIIVNCANNQSSHYIWSLNIAFSCQFRIIPNETSFLFGFSVAILDLIVIAINWKASNVHIRQLGFLSGLITKIWYFLKFKFFIVMLYVSMVIWRPFFIRGHFGYFKMQIYKHWSIILVNWANNYWFS